MLIQFSILLAGILSLSTPSHLLSDALSFNDLVQKAYAEASATSTTARLQLQKGEQYQITSTCILDKPIHITGPDGQPFSYYPSPSDGLILASVTNGPAISITSGDVHLALPDFSWDNININTLFPLIDINLPQPDAIVHIQGGTLEFGAKGISFSGGSCYITNTVFIHASNAQESTAITANLSPGHLNLQNTHFNSDASSLSFYTACAVECLGDVAILSISNAPDNNLGSNMSFSGPFCKTSVQIKVQPQTSLPPPQITFLMDHAPLHGIVYPIALILPDERGLQYFDSIALSYNRYENDPPDLKNPPTTSSSLIHFLKDAPGLPAITPVLSSSTKMFIPKNPQAKTSNALPPEVTLFSKTPVTEDSLQPLEKTAPKLSVKTKKTLIVLPSHVQPHWDIEWNEEEPITNTDIDISPAVDAEINLPQKRMAISSTHPVTVTLTPKHKHAVREVTAGEEHSLHLPQPKIIRFQP